MDVKIHFLLFTFTLMFTAVSTSDKDETCSDDFQEIQDVQKCMLAATKVQKHPENEKSVTEFLVHCMKFLEKLGFSESQTKLLNHLIKKNLNKERTAEKISDGQSEETNSQNESNVTNDNIDGKEPNHDKTAGKEESSVSSQQENMAKKSEVNAKSESLEKSEEPNIETQYDDVSATEEFDVSRDSQQISNEPLAFNEVDSEKETDDTQSEFAETRVYSDDGTSDDTEFDTPPHISQDLILDDQEVPPDHQQRALEREQELFENLRVPPAQQFQPPQKQIPEHGVPQPPAQEFPQPGISQTNRQFPQQGVQQPGIPPPPQQFQQPGVPPPPHQFQQPGIPPPPHQFQQPGIPQQQQFRQPGIPQTHQQFPQPGVPLRPQQSMPPTFQAGQQGQYDEKFIAEFKAEMAKRGFPDAPLPPYPAQHKPNVEFKPPVEFSEQDHQEQLLPQDERRVPNDKQRISEQQVFHQEAFENPHFEEFLSDEENDYFDDSQIEKTEPMEAERPSRSHHSPEDL